MFPALRTIPRSDSKVFRFRILISANITNLTACKKPVYFYKSFSLLFQLVFQECGEHSPSVIHNRFSEIQRLRHCLHIQILVTNTITGRFVNSSVKSGVVSIKIKPDDSEENETYECASNISVTYDGSPATVRSFADGDVVTVNLVNGKIASLAGESKTTTISGATIEDMEIGDDIKITISHGNDAYNGKTYAVSSDVVVKKNTSTVDLSSIYKGDKVTLTLKYGVITQINATSSTKVIEGTIQSLTIATKSIMVVKVDNKEQTYEIPSGVQILINGEEKTLYDFRVGDIVKLTVESDAITKIVATSTQESSGSMSGVVTGINTSYGVISVQPEGSTDSKQAFCKDGNTTFVTAAGIAKKMKDIKVGQKVEIKGTISGGVFIGKLVVIVSE